jgi:hypothetical protein
MFLMTYYLSLLQVHQAHAKQDALNKGHHQWRRNHHRAKQILLVALLPPPPPLSPSQ